VCLVCLCAFYRQFWAADVLLYLIFEERPVRGHGRGPLPLHKTPRLPRHVMRFAIRHASTVQPAAAKKPYPTS
jgi:hypothetical protein